MAICGTESCNKQVQVEGGFCHSCLLAASKNTKDRQVEQAIKPAPIEYETSNGRLSSGQEKPYSDLRSLASLIVFFASMLKVFAYLFMAGAMFAGFWDSDHDFLLFGIVALIGGWIIYMIALIISATGEALLALADIALYTSRIPKPKAVNS
jgi:hypothetical protein